MRKFLSYLFLSLALLSQIAFSRSADHKDVNYKYKEILSGFGGNVVFLKVDQVKVGTTYLYKVVETENDAEIKSSYLFFKVSHENDSEVVITTLRSEFEHVGDIDNVSIYSKETGFATKRITAVPDVSDELPTVDWSKEEFEFWFQNYKSEDVKIVDYSGKSTNARRVKYQLHGQLNNEILFSKNGLGLNSVYSMTQKGTDSDGNLFIIKTSLIDQYQQKN